MGEEVEIEEKKSDYEDQIKVNFLKKVVRSRKVTDQTREKIDMVTKGFMKSMEL